MTSTPRFRTPPSSATAASGSGRGLPCAPFTFSTTRTPLPFTSRRRSPSVGRGRQGFAIRGVHGRDVVTIHSHGVPAEGPGAVRVRIEVPAVHGLAPLPKPVHIDDRGQVVEAFVGGVFERLAHRTLRHLARRTAPRPGRAAGRAACRPGRGRHPRAGLGRVTRWPSTHGSAGVWWPSRRLPNRRKVNSSSLEMAPIAFRSAS